MKIGILTYHYGYNFGGVLQCYALQKTLMGIGYDNVSVINCIPSRLRFYLGGIPRKRSLKLFYDWYLRVRYGKKCRSAFDAFRKNYLHTTRYVSRKELPLFVKDYDALIVGSDQIWNIREQSDGMFFLSWNPEYHGRRIAYAPCCGKNEVSEKERFNIRDALYNFDSLSVRNTETFEFVKGITGLTPIIVPDPTCLYDFRDLLLDKPIRRDRYIFTYILGKEINGGCKKAIELIKKKLPGCIVIASVIAYSNPQKIDWADEIMYCLSPVEWINMIQNASFVLTDSFHGTIFSMMFNTPFITYYAEERRKSRFIELANQFEISKNIVSRLEEIDSFVIENKSHNDKFEVLSTKGIAFLKDALA